MAGFDPPDTTADPAKIEASATDLVTIANRITGRGDDLSASMALLGPQFSDLIAASITSQAGYNEQAWRAAARGVVYGAAVTSQWSADVTWFKTERQKLVSEWAAAESGNFGVASPDTTNLNLVHKLAADTMYQARLVSAKAATLADLTTRANALWEQFQQRASERGSQLSQGPTPENLAALAEAGTPGIVVTALPNTGSGSSLVNGDAGAADGAVVVDAIASGEPSEEFVDVMHRLDLVADDAYVKQLNGEQLSGDQLAYLNSFYTTLGHDVYQLPGYIQQNYDASPPAGGDGTGGPGGADRWMLAAAGGGILALSNETLTGGTDMTPAAIKEFLENPAVDYSGPWPTFTVDAASGTDSYQKFAALVTMTAATDGEFAGGTAFSELLTMRVVEFGNAASLVPDNHGDLPPDMVGRFTDDDTLLRQALDVSTRNEQANYHILTGRFVADDATWALYSQQPGRIPTDRTDFILDTLFRFDWSDDGASAGGLVDWIGEDALLTGPDGDRAREAYIFLTSRLTDDPHSGPDPVRSYVDADGNLVQVDDTGLTMEQVAGYLRTNPKISDALAVATAPNIELFGWAADETKWNPDTGSGALSTHDASRMLMLSQYTQDGRDTLTVASQAYAYHLMLTDNPQWESADDEMYYDGKYAGVVRGMVDAGAENAIWYQNVSDSEAAQTAIDEHKKRTETVINVISLGAPRLISDLNVGAGGVTNWVLDSFLDQVPELLAGDAPAAVAPPDQTSDWPMGPDTLAAYDVVNFHVAQGGDRPDYLMTVDGDGNPVAITQPTGDQYVDEQVMGLATSLGYGRYLEGYAAGVDHVDGTRSDDADEIKLFVSGEQDPEGGD